MTGGAHSSRCTLSLRGWPLRGRLREKPPDLIQRCLGKIFYHQISPGFLQQLSSAVGGDGHTPHSGRCERASPGHDRCAV